MKLKFLHLGYTIIEVLLVLSVIGLILVIGYANFRNYSQRKRISNYSRLLKADLRLAQENAISGKKDCSLGSLVFGGYNFRFVNATTYKMESFCMNGLAVVDLKEVKTVSFPADVTLTAPSPNPLTFKPLGEGTNIVGVPGYTEMTLSSQGYLETIRIGVGGEIR